MHRQKSRPQKGGSDHSTKGSVSNARLHSSRGRWRCPRLAVAAAAAATTAAVGWPTIVDAAATLPAPLDLEAFEDAECLDDPGSEILLELLAEMSAMLDDITFFKENGNPKQKEEAWAVFRSWKTTQGPLLLRLIATIFNGPYCESGKVASATATCLLLLASDEDEETIRDKVLTCAMDVETMLQDTAPVDVPLYDTRLHMFLRSPWPTFQLLDALVRLYPANDGTDVVEMDLGRCAAHEDWYGEQLEFNWPWFKAALKSSLDVATSSTHHSRLRFNDGPLSEQYRARWLHTYKAPNFREAAAFSSEAFYKFRRMQWEAGCHPGIVAAYLMQIVVFSARDTEAWLQRYVGAGWRLLNLLSPLTRLMHTDWPVFRVLQLGSHLRRHPRPWMPGDGSSTDPRAKPLPAVVLHDRVRDALAQSSSRVVYITSAWGSFARFVGPFLARWSALSLPHLLFLALDANSLKQCSVVRSEGSSIVCIDAPQRFGLEGAVAKYLALASAAQFGAMAVWLDLDVYIVADPTAHLEATLSPLGGQQIAFMGFLNSRTLSPAIVAARGGRETAEVLLRFASWLYENPYILDHQGWDAFLQNREGDFGSGWDYKGRSINSSEAAGDGLEISFAPPQSSASSTSPMRYTTLGYDLFGSGDGWTGDIGSLLAFHFWGSEEGQEDLFNVFYPFSKNGFSSAAAAVVRRYFREPTAFLPTMAAAAQASSKLHLTAISYAHGCCAKALRRNRQSAIDVGVDEAISYGFVDLDPQWVALHEEVLSQRKGAGWWLWKPYFVLKTLLSDAVPWHTGVVMWLDAGNQFVGDPRPLALQALEKSDVAGLRLKCCIENDWTSLEALRRLQGLPHSISDRPQLGAYFLLFRKTSKTIAFVEEWLRLSEDPDILTESDPSSSMEESPGYQRHMADQSVFSVLFKQRGFQALSLEDGHKVVRLDRWRE